MMNGWILLPVSLIVSLLTHPQHTHTHPKQTERERAPLALAVTIAVAVTTFFYPAWLVGVPLLARSLARWRRGWLDETGGWVVR